jgi:hypothetical protein
MKILSDCLKTVLTSPYLTILGGIDGVLLLKLMLEREPNFKIIANFLLHRIAPLKNYIMPVNPLKIIRMLNPVVGIKETLRHLSDETIRDVFSGRSFKL